MGFRCTAVRARLSPDDGWGTPLSKSTGVARRLFAAASRIGFARRLLFVGYDWMLRRKRPLLAFERALGIDTRGFLPPHALLSGSALDAQNTAYGGVMPSVLRRVLALLPDIADTHFVDLGAGKGRALAVASEFPFRSLTGIELSPDLCAIARRNARIIARQHPARAPIRIVEGDASRPDLPSDQPVALFLYHSFGAELVAILVDHLARIAARGRRLFFISLNPVHGDIFDAHPAFTRWYAAQIAYTQEECEAAPDESDAIVIWQAGPPTLSPHADADRAIEVTKPGWRCELSADQAAR